MIKDHSQGGFMQIDFSVILSGVIQLLLSLAVGIVYILSAYWLFKKLTLNIDDTKELKNKNTALAVFMGATIFSVIFISRHAVDTGINGILIVVNNPKLGAVANYLIAAGLFLADIGISGLIAFLSVWIGVLIIMKLTKNIDEMKEIAENNLAVAILAAVVIIGLAIFIDPAINLIMKGLIPYPAMDMLPRLK
jgi:uncharacterized membrane protein YjfL (UPF0719 family)